MSGAHRGDTLRHDSTLSIDVAAPAELVFGLARDVRRWPALLPHYARSRLVERRPDGAIVVEFVARRPLARLLGLGAPGGLALPDLARAADAASPLRPRRRARPTGWT